MLFVLPLVLLIANAAVAQSNPGAGSAIEGLESELLAASADDLARDAMKSGDAARGAILFHQATTGCAKCHSVDDGDANSLGPNLAKLGGVKPNGNSHIVTSILKPSEAIREGYRALAVLTTYGKVKTGLLISQNDDAVTLRDPTSGEPVVIADDAIEQISPSKTSIMPAGIAVNLASRQQFLDLVRYVIEIRDGGPDRAKELQPPASLIAFRVPQYESQVDHAGLIASLDQDAFRRGKAIYDRLCINCHGTIEKPGSLPTALRFSEGKFKVGSDPYSMYHTLTHGFGLMVPQTWMVPRQKYDAVHYIREHFVKSRNPEQYREVTPQYLDSLPKGDTFGPEARDFSPWSDMDYGPWMFNTVEVGKGGGNIAYKGLSVRLDPGPGGVAKGSQWILFDHDTMRVAAAWSRPAESRSGFIDWRGIHFDGRHNAHPKLVGELTASNPTGPGWAHPVTGSFEDDQRVVGRDNKRYGPLPRDWAQYHGAYQTGEDIAVSYSVGEMNVLESFARLNTSAETPGFVRLLHLGPNQVPQVMSVATHSESGSAIQAVGEQAIFFGPGGQGNSNESANRRAETSGRFNATGWLETDDSSKLDTAKGNFTITARVRTQEDGVVFTRTAPGAEWVPNGTSLFIRGGRLCYDVGWVGAIESRQRITDNRWHDIAVTSTKDNRETMLFVDGIKVGSGSLQPEESIENAVIRIGFCSENFPGSPRFEGQIQDVRYYHGVLDDDQIAAGPDKDPRLVASWLAEDQSGPKLKPVHDARAISQGGTPLYCGVAGDSEGVQFETRENRLCLVIPPGEKARRLAVWMARGSESLYPQSDESKALVGTYASSANESLQLADWCQTLVKSDSSVNTQPLWRDELTTQVITIENSANGQAGRDAPTGFEVDVLQSPESNPWFARLRFSGLDFFPGGDAMAISTWDGDVFHVTGILGNGSTGRKEPEGSTDAATDATRSLRWRRIASGLFQPLGVKIVDETIYVTCRDQLVILRDRNGDGATDHYECFNNDHQVTEHFHEFAMGLQRDEDGNFYYAKSARHAKTALVPHHGTLLKVSPDGEKTDILAVGFRAANGVCLNPDGTFIVTDQEGHWNPKNRINWVAPGGFYGNMYGYHDVTDSSDDRMDPPLCWITNAFDRSPAELLWVDSPKWGNLNGTLLNLSYGYGKVFSVPHQHLSDGRVQGGMCQLPLPQFPTGTMRGRFNDADGQLYICGLFAWASSQQAKEGGVYRIRYTGHGATVPVANAAIRDTITVTFSDALDKASVGDLKAYDLKTWALKRTRNYGSKHYDEKRLSVEKATLADDGKTLVLTVPDLHATWCYELKCRVRRESDQSKVERVIHGTIHQL